jgi:glycerophosphoryl diester phosphodiesterase
MLEKKQKKKPYKLLLFIFSVLLLIGAFGGISLERERETKPFFKDLKTPIIIAHRGGSTFPENTLPAFHHSRQIGADAFEFDIHMTKDGHLVVIHDSTVDRTTNGTGSVHSLTFDEIMQLDAGYRFLDAKGTYPYRDKGVTIPTVEQVFQMFPTMRMNIEIKAQYPKGNKSEIVQKLWQLIEK